MVDDPFDHADVDPAQAALALRQSYIMSAPAAVKAWSIVEPEPTVASTPSCGTRTTTPGVEHPLLPNVSKPRFAGGRRHLPARRIPSVSRIEPRAPASRSPPPSISRDTADESGDVES